MREKVDLDALIQAARERGPMTPAEHQEQRESWAKGEAGMGSDRDEARERAAFRAANPDFSAGDDGWQARPIPADTRAVAREALDECSLCFNRESGLGKKIRDALDALDAAPTEKVVGYGVLTEGLGLSFRATRAEADTTAAIMRGAGRGKFRIVRLVAEDE